MGGWVGGCWAVVNPVVRVMVRKGGGGDTAFFRSFWLSLGSGLGLWLGLPVWCSSEGQFNNQELCMYRGLHTVIMGSLTDVV